MYFYVYVLHILADFTEFIACFTDVDPDDLHSNCFDGEPPEGACCSTRYEKNAYTWNIISRV